MKRVNKLVMIITGIFMISAFTLLNVNWNIDSNYSIKFSGSQAEGSFSGLSGTINFNPDDLSKSLVQVKVDANTIKTGNSTKDKHAKGEDWFDVAKFPYIQFSSSSFIKSGNFTVVSGTLDLHGIKKKIQVPFTFSEAEGKGIFIGKFRLNRKDYGINGNFFGFTVGKEFEVTLNIPVTK